MNTHYYKGWASAVRKAGALHLLTTVLALDKDDAASMSDLELELLGQKVATDYLRSRGYPV